MRPGKRAALDLRKLLCAMIDEVERIKAGVRAKVEHSFQVIRRQFSFVKIRYCWLIKSTAQLTTLCALSTLRIARCKLLQANA